MNNLFTLNFFLADILRININRPPIELINPAELYIPSQRYDPTNGIHRSARNQWEQAVINSLNIIINDEKEIINSIVNQERENNNNNSQRITRSRSRRGENDYKNKTQIIDYVCFVSLHSL